MFMAHLERTTILIKLHEPLGSERLKIKSSDQTFAEPLGSEIRDALRKGNSSDEISGEPLGSDMHRALGKINNSGQIR